MCVRIFVATPRAARSAPSRGDVRGEQCVRETARPARPGCGRLDELEEDAAVIYRERFRA